MYESVEALPGVFIAGESITNSNNSTNIRKNLKSFLGMPTETRKSYLMKKTGHEKSRDTVPLRQNNNCTVLSMHNVHDKGFNAK
jgi:hypothetical protein